MIDGTTLCPHCDTRFRIAAAQLEAHQGMVRCGHCLQAFDARPNFIPDHPDPQLELPILADELAAQSEHPHAGEDHALEPALPEQNPPEEHVPGDAGHPVAVDSELTALSVPVADTSAEAEPAEASAVAEEPASAETAPVDHAVHDSLDFSQPIAIPDHLESTAPPAEPPHAEAETERPMTLAEQVAIVQDEEESTAQRKPRRWPWAIGSLLLLLLLLAQAAYFFRVDLAARIPELKPALIGYCELLKCSVPLPQKTDLMGIESSDLEADPAHENQITLNALLRNRATFAQAFPNLELTLNDSQDRPLARRVFHPSDYLPPVENEKTGLLPNHELSIKVRLDTTDLKPSGYRLVLFYPNN